MTRDIRDEKRTQIHRWLFRVLGALVAIGVAGIAGQYWDAWAAAMVGVGVGFVATWAAEWWDDRHAPDLVAIFEEAKK